MILAVFFQCFINLNNSNSMAGARVDDQSCRHFYSEEAGEATTPHHAYHGLRTHTLPEETGPSRSGPRESVSETFVGRITQG